MIKTTEAANLLREMGAAGISTYVELAKLSGVSDRTIRNFRTVGKVRLSTVDKLAAALGCTRGDLLDERPKRPPGSGSPCHGDDQP